LPDHNNAQANHPGVNTKTVQRTICELVSTLTPEILIRLEGPQTEFHTILLSRLEGVLEANEKHFSDHARLDAAKAVHRTVAMHQLNLTNAQFTETYECARETTHDLRSLSIQLARVVDALHTPQPVVVTTSSVNHGIPSPQILPFKRLRSRIPFKRLNRKYKD
jgi:hypothetical protein